MFDLDAEIKMIFDQMEKLHYNFVFLFAESDYWQAILGREIFKSEHSRVYLGDCKESRLKCKLFHYHWSYRLNAAFHVPFKSLWYKDMYEHGFTEDLPIVFVFMGGNNIRFAGDFCEYVRKRNPQNKIVISHNDMIAKHIRDYSYDTIRNMADLVMTYDENEAKKYGIEYFQETTYSKLLPESSEEDIKYDVFFLGAAKDRLDRIMDSYHFLKEKGLRVKFIVPGVPREKRIVSDGLEYEYIPYEQNLKYIIQSKCLLEIIQEGSVDITTRALEAIAYRRKFMTDCSMDLSTYFNVGQCYQFKNINEVSENFLKAEFSPSNFSPCYDFNPLKRLFFIQKKLDEQKKQE